MAGFCWIFIRFPIRPAEVPDKPEDAVLKMGYVNSIYGRSLGGITPSGWSCEHLPYLVEFDNGGRRIEDEGKPNRGRSLWGYDEIGWFAHQSDAFRNQWLRYVWNWVRTNDPNGFLEMPGSRPIIAPVNGSNYYFANMPSKAMPDGFGQEDTIKDIWARDGTILRDVQTSKNRKKSLDH